MPDFQMQLEHVLTAELSRDDAGNGPRALQIHPKYTRFVEQVKSHRRHPLHGNVDAVARLILDFEIFSTTGLTRPETISARRAQLSEALSKEGCTLRSDSSFCQQWIHGSVFVLDVEEVVATMMITKRLFEFSHYAWSMCRGTFESRLERDVFEVVDGLNVNVDANVNLSTNADAGADANAGAGVGRGQDGRIRLECLGDRWIQVARRIVASDELATFARSARPAPRIHDYFGRDDGWRYYKRRGWWGGRNRYDYW